MTKNKRYFKREWEEEYYIFDSETISEEEFDEKVEYGYDVFADSMQGDEVVDKLNELHEENTQLKNKLKFLNELNKPYGTIIEENKRLKTFIKQVTNKCGEIVLMNGTVYNVKKALGDDLND